MPPKAAPKEKVAKGDEAEELVISYLKTLMAQVNRPYASTDVAANLKNKVPKAAAQKIMMALAEKGTLTKKDYGKQTIFVYNQALLKILTTEEMAEVDRQTKATLTEVDEGRKELRGMMSELSAKEAQPKTKDLGREIDRIKVENEITGKALVPYRGDNGTATITPLNPEEIKRIDNDWIRCRKEWVARKRVYVALLNMLKDASAVADVAELEEDQGIAVDDDDAKDVENSEFCKPPPILRAKVMTKTVASAGIQRTSDIKRPAASEPSSQESEEKAQPKKKAKKA